MPSICKKHGKPRDVIYERKMPNGSTFSVIGCKDCVNASTEGKKFLTKKKKATTGNLRKI
jgi:hypothetical protein